MMRLHDMVQADDHFRNTHWAANERYCKQLERDARKAKAVASAVKGPVTPIAPCSILQRHGDVNLFLDPPAAAGL